MYATLVVVAEVVGCKMKVEYINHMGSDLLVANAARVSLDKHHKEFEFSDAKLLNFLARNKHWTPFAHPTLCLRISVPIFVANQLKRHQVGLVVNEVSRRYVDNEPEFYITNKLGARAENKKQGAKEGEFIYSLGPMNSEVKHILGDAYTYALDYYNFLLKHGVAPEDARMVLPLSTYTSWYWTGSLYAYSRIYNLRAKPDAQRQTQEVARMISSIIEPLFPYSWNALIVNRG